VFTPDELLDGMLVAGPVVVFDDDHYYLGAVLAEKLRLDGLDVALVTPADAFRLGPSTPWNSMRFKAECSPSASRST